MLSRYARARAWAGAFADADAAWQRGAEFATRARLFTDIAGWLSCQVRLRYRYGPTDLAEIGDMRQMIKLLSEQPSERVVPIAGVREEVLDALRRVTKSSARRRPGLRGARSAGRRRRSAWCRPAAASGSPSCFLPVVLLPLLARHRDESVPSVLGVHVSYARFHGSREDCARTGSFRALPLLQRRRAAG